LRKLARKKAFGLQTKRHGTCDKIETFGDVGALRRDSNQNGENNAQSDWFPKQHSDVIIPIEKLTDYLLVFQLKNDKSKFLAQAGYTQSNPKALEQALRDMFASYEAFLDNKNEYGEFYRVEGMLKGVNQCDLFVVTVWIMRAKEEGVYRFVTLKPWRKNHAAT